MNPTGVAYPVVILIVVTLLMTYLARRRRFGRYVYAYGGNPEAAELGGINTRRTVMLTFMLMGVLVAVSAAIQTARLNARGHEPRRPERARRDRRRRHRRHVVLRRDRDDPRRRARRDRHAVAALRAWCCCSIDSPSQDIVVGVVLVTAVAIDSLAAAAGARADQRTVVAAASSRRADRATLGRLQRAARDRRAARRDAQHPRGLRRPPRRRRRQHRPLSRRGRRPRRRQRRRQVDADAHAVGRPPGRLGRDPDQRRARDHPQPARRARHGIEIIYQKLALADNIDAAGNVFLGRELTTRTGALDDSAMAAATRKVMARLNPRFKNLKTPVRSLSGGQRQSVAIARAVHFNAKILIMDEPTAALGPAETAQVRDLVTQLKAEGIGIFLISHDIHDVFDLADRISVMLQGKLVGTVDKDEVTKDEVLAMIIMGKKPGEVSDDQELAAIAARLNGTSGRVISALGPAGTRGC